MAIRRLGRSSSPSPSLVVGVLSGWADAGNSTLAQRAHVGTRVDPLPHRPRIDPASGRLVLAARPTDGIRRTLGISVRLVVGALSIGMARALDHRAQWRLTLATGQSV